MNSIKTNIPNILSQFAKDFNYFVKENKKNISSNSILSFAFPIKGFDLINALNAFDKEYDDFIFLEKSNENYAFAAINRLVDLPGNKNGFQSLNTIIKDLKTRLICNWQNYEINNPPFVTGGVKFNPANSSTEWNDFNPIHFFVPQIIVLQKEDRTFLVYNFEQTPDDSEEEVFNNFRNSVSSVLSLNNNVDNGKNFIITENGFSDNEKKSWNNSVTDAINDLGSDFKKVVLSRRIILETQAEINWKECFNSLEEEYPGCYLFILKSRDSRFFGASPEKFISIHNKKIEIDAIAGTVSGTSDSCEADLMTEKNFKEHKYVIDFISNSLLKYTNGIKIDRTPQIKKLKNVHHLYTKISAEIKSDGEGLNLIESMFPTPAVCGLPKLKAMAAINKLEKFDRGLFSGLVGWMDLDFNCDFAVAIRSALYKSKKLYLYAGAGIVDESVPEEEFIETDLKFNTILNLFSEENTS